LASLALHAATNLLEWTYGLESDAANDHPLQSWWRRWSQTLDTWVPETRGDVVSWPEWYPPPGESPFADGRVDWPILKLVAEPTRLVFVLVRDWDFDLRAVSAPPFDYDELFLFLAARERTIAIEPEDTAREYGLPVSAWTILAAAVRVDPDLAPLVDQERLDALLRTAASPTDGGTTYRPSATISRDYWTTEDELGYDFYADAVVEFVLHPDTKPPLTIGIKAPWGAGKTSLMRLVRKRLDPSPAQPLDFRLPTERIDHRDVLRRIREPPDEAPAKLAPAVERDEPAVDVSEGRRLTVWFNAWKYQSSEQVWAGLADAILTQ